jgi:hypothetical protein
VSFLDNLENSLKALESQEQGGLDESRRRESERERAVAAAPWAERLKSGPYTKALMSVATRAGYSRRLKVHLVWIGTSLRLEAGTQRLELRPEPDGVAAVFLDGNAEIRRGGIHLTDDPQKLVDQWMELVDVWRKREEELAAASPLPED